MGCMIHGDDQRSEAIVPTPRGKTLLGKVPGWQVEFYHWPGLSNLLVTEWEVFCCCCCCLVMGLLNLYAIQLIHLKWIFQWFLVYSQTSATISMVNYKMSSSQRETAPFSDWSLHFPPTPPTPGNFLLYGFAYSGHFLWVELHSMCPFVTSLFHLPSCPQGSFTL